MPLFKYVDQVCLVSASMAIHNLIRWSNKKDIEFDIYDNNPDLVPEDDPGITGEARHGPSLNNETERERIRDQICTHIVMYN